MELKKIIGQVQGLVEKYRYAVLVLLIGLALLWIPGKSSIKKPTEYVMTPEVVQKDLTAESLVEILQTIHGAGRVKVLLSTASGEETVYQTDSDSDKVQTVIITDSQRSESGLVRQVNPPAYLGAIVVCEGAESPAVKFAITQAVAKITGLGTDAICVLKMK